ncbi:carboxyl-terminal processing protease [Dysgonomonas sp. PFB1-18]|uniref:S41 family peptidase n=1 Tax=unclassified Dysgonomonas TaxID=2630389 RepID=UPI002474EF20|nr:MULTISPECIES: S41 family peptidase [unclassified Dysgonomonas]MDL2303498.1 hypothetical protein [Dysgonomonas sp. OttesenSCG-928-D17]MDH6309906.1 carboxyl-terminal processing protease [Dysgonomonas sp. PF1-14]MDH6339450.1 carboxyl-terminal processing protease [Dysgonomonas sp. PF1-16]MDH6380950.1 carboxyl-terminal processing protease [Dysgonomonas sp. PFB1-18]MDH6397959.1 carboxyl-terminal processing protease [Dysgonomonas sp. PF1-23]
MKAKLTFLLIFTFALLSFNACKDSKDDDDLGKEMTDDEYTNRWIYNKMKSLYLWNTDLPASPDFTQESKPFFRSILFRYGNVNGDRFSWIEEDKSKETKSLFAEPNLGFEYIPMSYFATGVEKESSSLGFFVVYVHKGSDAESKELKRGQVIYKVNGTDVDYDNYKDIFDGKTSLTLSVYDNDGAKTTLRTIQASEKKKSPVFISKVIPNTKIGYLMYNGFERGPDEEDENNFEYDIQLMQSIQSLYSQGITDLVLDLRYNPGGYLTSAIDLASALYPGRTGKIFAREKYNKHFEDSLLAKYNNDKSIFDDYFLEKAYNTDVTIPKSKLTRLYIIAAEYSASASELVLHNLRPYMTVYHIGETTVGKDKASMTVDSKDSRIKWQIQPLISRLSDVDGNGNYINGLTPDKRVSEWAEGYTMQRAIYSDGSETEIPSLSMWIGGLAELGEPSEPLLAEAIYHIQTGSFRPNVKSTTLPSKTSVRVPRIQHNNESRQRIIIDADRFSDSRKNK